jgi:hypothetical protein
MINYVVNSRAYSVTIDKFGVDPLRDKTLDLISKIPKYSQYQVTQYLRGRPDQIAHFVYGQSNLWWVITSYNGILNVRTIVEGTVLNVPDYSAVIAILAAAASQSYGTKIRTIVI